MDGYGPWAWGSASIASHRGVDLEPCLTFLDKPVLVLVLVPVRPGPHPRRRSPTPTGTPHVAPGSGRSGLWPCASHGMAKHDGRARLAGREREREGDREEKNTKGAHSSRQREVERTVDVAVDSAIKSDVREAWLKSE